MLDPRHSTFQDPATADLISVNKSHCHKTKQEAKTKQEKKKKKKNSVGPLLKRLLQKLLYSDKTIQVVATTDKISHSLRHLFIKLRLTKILIKTKFLLGKETSST